MVPNPNPPTEQSLIHLIVNPGVEPDDLGLTVTQIESLVVPALRDHGLDVRVHAVDAPEVLEDLPAAGITLPLTLAWTPTHSQPADIWPKFQDQAWWQQTLQEKGFLTGPGSYWLPVVVTAKGVLYGELIGRDSEGNYQQPIHLSDKMRQPLYYLARHVLNQLGSPWPGCYCLQVGWIDDQVCFERLWPFPIQPALASLGIQSPDLFYAHYRCLAGLPLRDLRINADVTYQVLNP